MMTAPRRFPRSSAGLLLAGVATVFLAAAAPAEAPIAKSSPVVVPDVTPAPQPAQAEAPVAPQTKPPMPKQISLAIDQTRILELDGPVSTLSVGNPSIADVSIQNGNHLFLLGKSFGRTNVVTLDQAGNTVLDMTVFVTSVGSVTVYKGNRQLTYNCAPNCERALMPGDSKEDFDMLSGQITTKTGMGTSAGSRE